MSSLPFFQKILPTLSQFLFVFVALSVSSAIVILKTSSTKVVISLPFSFDALTSLAV